MYNNNQQGAPPGMMPPGMGLPPGMMPPGMMGQAGAGMPPGMPGMPGAAMGMMQQV